MAELGSAIVSANTAGSIASGNVPSGSSTGARSGDAAIALISWLSRATTASGVPAGAQNAFHE